MTDDTIKLVFVVYYTTMSKLEATVEDLKVGKRRRIDIGWKSKDPTPVPANWWELVVSEVEFQRAEEDARAKGRFLF